MVRLTLPIAPQTMVRADVFTARQYPRQAFDNVIDPVLNIDWFEMKGPTFPAHPHAGFSAVTYLFAESPNGLRNRDSLGGEHVIRPGGLHWSRASRGMLHEETPLLGGGAVQGLQIFANLPAANQADEPGAFPVAPEEVRIETGQGWLSRIAVDGTAIGSALNALPAPIRVQEVSIQARGSYQFEVPPGWGGILIALKGSLSLPNGTELRGNEAIGFAAEGGGLFRVAATDGEARIAIVAGQQLNQPIHVLGPLMLASAEALSAARDHVAGLAIPTNAAPS